MKVKAITKQALFKPAIGAVLAVLCGLALWTRLGESWENASYDYLFRFGARAPTNKVVLILMDNWAYADPELGQKRGQSWDRGLHATLLNKLADDGCPLVVLDTFLDEPREALADKALAEALRRLSNVVLMAELASTANWEVEAARALRPLTQFLDSARTNWGVARLDPDLDLTVRRHWPFPAPGSLYSLPWTAARLAGANLREVSQEQWLRYYRLGRGWEGLSYPVALEKHTNYFRDKIVFIGNKPKTPEPDDNEEDEFRTPYTRWTGESMGGVEIIATSFLNLMNGDWLRRPAAWVEAMLLAATGVLVGAGLCQVALRKGFGLGSRLGVASGVAFVVALVVMLGAVSGSYFSKFWFPWLVIAGGQVPCALAWAVGCALVATPLPKPPEPSGEENSTVLDRPIVHGYDYLANQPIGEGGFGKVWLVRDVFDEALALKAVYHAKSRQYEAEFEAIKRYKPVSNNHRGLLRVLHADLVSKPNRAGYFYYVMELGDSLVPDWEKNPNTYEPRNLASVRAQAPRLRLPVSQCLEIVIPLAEALDFLHRQGLTHRDIKPENIIFVKGHPKLADVGLVTDIRPPDRIGSRPGTFGYTPPNPAEPVGTVVADIYGLGKVLYVISTGRQPDDFPVLSTTLLEKTAGPDFMRLNPLINKACARDASKRYASAAEMRAALLEVKDSLGDDEK